MKQRHIAQAWGLSLLALGAAAPLAATPRLAPIWSEHAVIQRDAPITVEGSADPGEAVQVTLGTAKEAGRADAAGHFAVRFPARPASAQPVALTLSDSSGEVERAGDLLVGDVWLCSGQSNMEFTQAQALNAWNEQQSAHDGALRMATVPKAVALTPQGAFGGPVAWEKTTPETVGHFSAACYYMAKDLRRKLGVPVGAIHASWGGSEIRPWLSPAGGAAIYGKAEVALLALYERDPAAALAAFAPQWQAWYAKASGGSEPWAHPDALAWQDVPQAGAWNRWSGTALAGKERGTVWYRRTVTLSVAQAKGAAKLALGALDDIDMTFVNGHPAGNTYGPAAKRTYTVPAGYLHAGRNEIMVAVTNLWGDGGMMSPPGTLSLAPGQGAAVPLGSGWRYAVAPMDDAPPRTPWDGFAGIGVMHNAMIAPIGHFALKGAAWYQGESDVGKPGYAAKLKALFAGWRAQFGADMRMLVVQIAGYGKPQIAPQDSATARLREEQREGVLGDRNAALVTAVDIGERIDIHPANKEVLGTRLAAAASGEALPQPVSATPVSGGVVVRFSGVEGALHSWGGKAVLSFELCAKTPDSCRFAAARADGDSVYLTGDGRPATRVRYGWADSPSLNLYDARPFPAPAFEMEIAKK
ncbi:sialate O-acetylesterase [Novosphingobium beihaiensis]|uniref:Ig-like domain-containing protein n=1 Tax=Novosphingobium beihaiensis TaxID=2930389 RepID=A0ABT0BRI1_9SPHN|nr:sialate O-acetylesterase [Novosphingobium beihaiensis]MCJ2187685.1 Ig-like domain-containing protein [Novosphingobium beihaiensis]